MRRWNEEEKKKLLNDIRAIKRLYSRGLDPERISERMETDHEIIEMIVKLLDNGYYNRNDLELLDATIIRISERYS